jgi:hypothetical protein
MIPLVVSKGAIKAQRFSHPRRTVRGGRTATTARATVCASLPLGSDAIRTARVGTTGRKKIATDETSTIARP